jgi:uncharacterized protein (DUF433 family)
MKEAPRSYTDRITADPRILGGRPVVRGTRISGGLVLEELAHNPDVAELLVTHPDLTRADVQAYLAYAEAMVSGEEVSPNRRKRESPMPRLYEVPVRTGRKHFWSRLFQSTISQI